MRRIRRRRGAALLLVLALVAIALALSYALLRTQMTSILVQGNASRQVDARQAAMAGLSAAMRKMHAADWAGVDVPLVGNLGPHEWYEASFETGDAALVAGGADDAEYPFRVTITSTGYAADPSRPTMRASHRAGVVMQLVRRRLSAEPANWAQLQEHTVYQWANANTYVQVPVQIKGPVWLQGPIQLCSEYPSVKSARERYLEDLERMRVAGLGDNRPLVGPVYAPNSRNSGTTRNLLKKELNLAVHNVSASDAQPLGPPSLVRSYRLYPGGKLYQAPTVQSQFGGSLANRTLSADPRTNPLGIFPSEGSLTINDNVTIEGTLLTGGSFPDVHIYGKNVTLRGRDLPALYQSTGRTQLPVALIRDDLRVRNEAQGSLTGMAVVWDEFEYRRGSAAMQFDLRGRLLTSRLLLMGRDSWDYGSGTWTLLLYLFLNQLDDSSAVPYFPQWLQTNLGLQTKPLLTIGPDSSGVVYHWQDWSQPVYVAHPDDGGLVWDLVRWQDGR